MSSLFFFLSLSLFTHTHTYTHTKGYGRHSVGKTKNMPFCLSAEKADYPWLNGKHLPWIEKLEALKAAMDNELSGSASADNHVDKDDDAWRCTYNKVLSFSLSLSLSPTHNSHTLKILHRWCSRSRYLCYIRNCSNMDRCIHTRQVERYVRFSRWRSWSSVCFCF